MNAIDQLIALADAYAAATQLSETTVSWRVFGDTKKLAAIRAGSDIHTTRFERAVAWFAANWPTEAIWPALIARPVEPVSGAEGAATGVQGPA